MNTREDEKWQRLLLRSASTFAEDPAPPFGFVTGTTARLWSEMRQQEEFERIGWHALLASLAALVLAATVTFGLDSRDNQTDFDPGVRSLIQVENIQAS
jgi:hypothetical protein